MFTDYVNRYSIVQDDDGNDDDYYCNRREISSDYGDDDRYEICVSDDSSESSLEVTHDDDYAVGEVLSWEQEEELARQQLGQEVCCNAQADVFGWGDTTEKPEENHSKGETSQVCDEVTSQDTSCEGLFEFRPEHIFSSEYLRNYASAFADAEAFARNAGGHRQLFSNCMINNPSGAVDETASTGLSSIEPIENRLETELEDSKFESALGRVPERDAFAEDAQGNRQSEFDCMNDNPPRVVDEAAKSSGLPNTEPKNGLDTELGETRFGSVLWEAAERKATLEGVVKAKGKALPWPNCEINYAVESRRACGLDKSVPNGAISSKTLMCFGKASFSSSEAKKIVNPIFEINRGVRVWRNFDQPVKVEQLANQQAATVEKASRSKTSKLKYQGKCWGNAARRAAKQARLDAELAGIEFRKNRSNLKDLFSSRVCLKIDSSDRTNLLNGGFIVINDLIVDMKAVSDHGYCLFQSEKERSYALAPVTRVRPLTKKVRQGKIPDASVPGYIFAYWQRVRSWHVNGQGDKPKLNYNLSDIGNRFRSHRATGYLPEGHVCLPDLGNRDITGVVGYRQ